MDVALTKDFRLGHGRMVALNGDGPDDRWQRRHLLWQVGWGHGAASWMELSLLLQRRRLLGRPDGVTSWTLWTELSLCLERQYVDVVDYGSGFVPGTGSPSRSDESGDVVEARRRRNAVDATAAVDDGPGLMNGPVVFVADVEAGWMVVVLMSRPEGLLRRRRLEAGARRGGTRRCTLDAAMEITVSTPTQLHAYMTRRGRRGIGVWISSDDVCRGHADGWRPDDVDGLGHVAIPARCELRRAPVNSTRTHSGQKKFWCY